MIVRDRADSWHVVLQPDHADLSAALAASWADRGSRHDSLVLATQRHDDGWAVWEASPQVDDAGKPVSFLEVDVTSHLAFYRACIAAVTEEDRYAGLLVSMHGAGIYRQRYGADPALKLTQADGVVDLVEAFVAEQEASRASRLAELGVDESVVWADYHRLQWYDRFSLAFCLRDWDTPGDAFALGEFHFEPLGPWHVRVSPYPLTAPVERFSLVRRLVPKRGWTQPEFRQAFPLVAGERVEVTFQA